MGLKPRHSLSTTQNEHWCTPDWILEVPRTMAGGTIALDPCSNPRSRVNAFAEYHNRPRAKWPIHRVDGLVTPWIVHRPNTAVRKIAYMNPPYSRGVIDQWVARAAEQSDYIDVVGLVPLRPSSEWWRTHCWPRPAGPCRGLCLLNRRVRFVGAPSGATWESCLVYWGDLPGLFGGAAAGLGRIYTTV
jgi:hypothetical protein